MLADIEARVYTVHMLTRPRNKVPVRPGRALLSLLLLGLPAIPSHQAHACECGRFTPFLPGASGATIVLRGRVLWYGKKKGRPAHMDVKVVRLWRGHEKRKVITVEGDNGKSCRPRVTEFKAGNEYILALFKTPPRKGATKAENEPRYELSVCGAYWLYVRANRAMGRIQAYPGRPGRYITKMRVEKLRRLVKPRKFPGAGG